MATTEFNEKVHDAVLSALKGPIAFHICLSVQEFLGVTWGQKIGMTYLSGCVTSSEHRCVNTPYTSK